MITGLIVVGLAFVGVIFVVRQSLTRLENRQSVMQSDSGFSMWSQDVYDGPRTRDNNTGMAVAAVASDMGSLDSRIETDSFGSSTDASDFSSSSDVGGLDN